MIKITAKKDGFRRCGVAHPKEATLHPDKSFTAAQLEILKKEPMLVVEIIEGGTAGAERLNVPKTVALVALAPTLEDLDKLAEGEDRKGVLDAIAKRRTELEAPTE